MRSLSQDKKLLYTYLKGKRREGDEWGRGHRKEGGG
jgi:hypothetical protein